MYQNVTFERSRHMFSIKLNSPVLLRKQLPVIAKALRVDEKVLEDFMTVSAFYASRMARARLSR